MATSALERIKTIREKAEKEVEAIKAEAVSELSKRIGEAREHLRSLETEYAQLTGKTVRGQRVLRKSEGGVKADFGSEKELEDLLKSADGHRINRKAINDAGFNLKSAMTVAMANQKRFGFQQKGAQGEVWLIK
jgi:sigma54-dependent transcription regulator